MTICTQSSPLFADISSAGLEKMMHCSGAKRLEYPSGAFLMQEGKSYRDISVILKGLCRMEKITISGQRQILRWIYPNDIVGEQIFCHSPAESWCDIIAVQPTQVLAIPAVFFTQICSSACKHHLVLTRNLLSIVSQTSLQQQQKLYLICGHSIRERLGIYLLHQMDKDGCVTLSMNREELADYLGITRPSLSRELAQLAKNGIISYQKNKIRILDQELYKQQLTR